MRTCLRFYLHVSYDSKRVRCNLNVHSLRYTRHYYDLHYIALLNMGDDATKPVLRVSDKASFLLSFSD